MWHRAALLLTLVAATLFALAVRAGDERFPVHTWKVDADTDGILVQDSRVGVVYVVVELPAGRWSGWAREADLPSAMAIQIYDPEGALRRRSDALAVNIGASASTRHSSVGGSCLAADLPAMLELMRDVLANDRFDRDELKRWKQQAQLEWKANEKDVEFRGRQLVARLLYRAGDPRLLAVEKPRRIDTDTARLKEIRDRILRLPGRTIGVAGALTPAEAERLVEDLLPAASADPRVDTAPALLPLRERAEREDSEARIPRLTQVYFGLGRESLTYRDPRYPAFVLANHVLGGHFYSRIMVALRHEGGETYGAFAYAETDIDPGPFTIGSFTRTENAPHAEEKLREALRTFHAGGLTEEERVEAVGYLTGNAPFARQAPHQVLLRIMAERRLGLPPGFFDGIPGRAAALALEEINAFVHDYYGQDAFVMGRVAPAK